MATRAGVGYSDSSNSRSAGSEAARAALDQAGSEHGDLVLVFATGKHDPALLRNGVRSVVGPQARLLGGAAVGVITNDHLGQEGYHVGVAVLSSDSMQADLFIERGLPNREYEAGVALGRQIRSRTYSGEQSLLLMYDLIKERTPEGFSVNLPELLLQGLAHSLEEWPVTAGLGMLGDMQLNPGFQWFDDEVQDQSALGLVLSGGVRMDTLILHGCRPASGYHTITRTEGNLLLEINDRPALDVFRDLLGHGADSDWEEYPNLIPIGINKGEKFAAFREDDYTVRFCSSVDRERRALVMSASDLLPGMEIQLMRRSINFDYMGERIRLLLERIGERRPFFALYIDCVARASAFCGTETEDATEVQNVLGDRMPLLGMYCGTEIARVGTEVVPNNFTGVLCLFSEDA